MARCGGAAKGLQFAPEEQDRRQGVMRQVIGGRGVNGAPRRGQRRVPAGRAEG